MITIWDLPWSRKRWTGYIVFLLRNRRCCPARTQLKCSPYRVFRGLLWFYPECGFRGLQAFTEPQGGTCAWLGGPLLVLEASLSPVPTPLFSAHNPYFPGEAAWLPLSLNRVLVLFLRFVLVLPRVSRFFESVILLWLWAPCFVWWGCVFYQWDWLYRH